MWCASNFNQCYREVKCLVYGAFSCQLSLYHCPLFIFIHLPNLLYCPDIDSITKYTTDWDMQCITDICQSSVSTNPYIWLPSFYHSFLHYTVILQNFLVQPVIINQQVLFFWLVWVAMPNCLYYTFYKFWPTPDNWEVEYRQFSCCPHFPLQKSVFVV
jgi:hypothetical protein